MSSRFVQLTNYIILWSGSKYLVGTTDLHIIRLDISSVMMIIIVMFVFFNYS